MVPSLKQGRGRVQGWPGCVGKLPPYGIHNKSKWNIILDATIPSGPAESFPGLLSWIGRLLTPRLAFLWYELRPAEPD